jgi:hypothetical protein
MAISKIHGQMLTDNLLRDGTNLAFDTDLLMLDVVNDRIGINDATPSETLSITGTLSVSGNTAITTLTNNRVVIAGTSGLLEDSANLTFDGTTLVIDNISSGTNNDLTITADGTGIVKITGNDGIRIPYGTTAQRPSTPVSSTFRYNSDLGYPEIYNGVIWEVVGPAAFAALTSQTITGDGATTVFTLDNSTTSAAIMVNINGIIQMPDTAYTVSANQITFAEAPVITDKVEIRFISEIASYSAITNANGTTKVDASGTGITLDISGNTVISIGSAEIFDATNAHSIQLPVYTVLQANALSNKSNGQLIYVSDGDSGNPCLAVYSGSDWQRIIFGVAISAT